MHHLWPTRTFLCTLHPTPKCPSSCNCLWKSIMDQACCSAASTHQAISPCSTPTQPPDVAPIQLLHPLVASPDISTVTGPTLSLPAFGVSTIPPANEHPLDPTTDSSTDTELTAGQQNFGQPRFGLLHTHFKKQSHARVCLH